MIGIDSKPTIYKHCNIKCTYGSYVEGHKSEFIRITILEYVGAIRWNQLDFTRVTSGAKNIDENFGARTRFIYSASLYCDVIGRL